MSILNKYKRWIPMLIPIKDEYWDFVLSQDNSPSYNLTSGFSENCLVSYIELGDENLQEEKGVKSSDDYVWEPCTSGNSIAVLDDIGYTGIDNGFIDYGGYSNVTNEEFYEIFTNSHYETPVDCCLHLHTVTGNTGLYCYPYEYVKDKYYAFKGGFLQGFYKLYRFDYQVLPNFIENEWNIEFTLRPRSDYDIEDCTLNTLHPENKGIFFFMGMRAEDKFIRIYNTDLEKYESREQPADCEGGYFAYDDDLPEDFIDVAERAGKLERRINIISAKNLTYFLNTYGYNWESNCGDGEKPHRRDINPSSCNIYLADEDYYNEDVIISGATIITSKGVPVEETGYYEIETDNKFLTFNRTKYGFTTATWDEDTVVVLTGSTNDIRTGNLFLLMNRTPSGYTTQTIDQYYSQNKKPFDFTADTINNAFAIKYNEDGSIGYRYTVRDCDEDEKYSVISENSFSGIIKDNEWSVINVKFSILNGALDNCNKPIGQRKMKIFIYVNGYLKFISKELPEFNFRELSAVAEKQEGVPFNISIGGGTQGLCDSIWVDYNRAFEKILPMEKNYAGTFIGDIKSFRFYACKHTLPEIKNNAKYELKQIEQWA